MQTLRRYGVAPYTVAVIHGGPGAAGEMAPVARELAPRWGVLEPLQTALSVPGQVDELRTTLERHGHLPITLVGFSWGAWLGFLLAARHPAVVHKLILVGSGAFEDAYAGGLLETRLRRLDAVERAEAQALLQMVEDAGAQGADAALARLGALLSQADAFDPLPPPSTSAEDIEVRAEVFQQVWPEAAELRSSGRLLAAGRQVRCPVVALHGDHDPHVAEGVRKPLTSVLHDFRFLLLRRCGHKPWIERQARDEFYRLLKSELPVPSSL